MKYSISRLFLMAALLLAPLGMQAGWNSYFAYDKVNRIAVSEQKVYAISNGALFSVEKMSEKIEKYDMQSGLHAMGLTCMHYDTRNKQLILIYATGKIDIMDENGVEYVPGLYAKDITSSKYVHNITVKDNIAYLGVDFGIVTMDLRKRVIVDTYYIGPNAREVAVKDIVFQDDSIYAITDSYLAKASMKDNIVDYRVWTRVALPGNVTSDPDKGVRVVDSNGDVWLAGGSRGVVRQSAIEGEICYKPDGPLQNTANSITYQGGRLYMVPGGRWAVQYNTPGVVMIYDGVGWKNITNAEIKAKFGNLALDFMNVAVDPRDPNHYFVTSYGNGLYEFRNDEVVMQYLKENSSLWPAAENDPLRYTRTDAAVYASNGDLFCLNSGGTGPTLCGMLADGTWGAVTYRENGAKKKFETATGLVLDSQRPNRKMFLGARENIGLMTADDAGTVFEEEDDQYILRTEWRDQDDNIITSDYFYALYQTRNGDLWIGTLNGPICIPVSEDPLTSDRCYRLRIQDGDAYLLENERINGFAEDEEGNLWMASGSMGVYVFTPDGKQMLAHYTSDNSSMPSNAVLSITYDGDHGTMYIGTSDGLVSYNPKTSGEGMGSDEDSDADMSEDGYTFSWHAYPSYYQMQRVLTTSDKVYGIASGSLYMVDKASEEVNSFTRLDGLHSSDIRQAAVCDAVDALILVYNNSMIDIVEKDGVHCMMDLSFKSSTMSIQVNDIAVSGNMAYLAMPFGIVAIEVAKHEVKDTYYIGEDAADVNVQAVAASADSIYAFSDGDLYVASKKDNLLDYHSWRCYVGYSDPVMKAVVHENHLYWLDETGHLFLRGEAGKELLFSEETFTTLVESRGRLLLKSKSQPIVRLTGKDTYETVSSPYSASGVDVAYEPENGYWLACPSKGIVRVKDSQLFMLDGPVTNDTYSMRFVGNRLFICSGGRWATEYGRPASFSMYDGNEWTCFTQSELHRTTDWWLGDLVDVAGDPNDPSTFYVASYGYGLIRVKNGKADVVYNEKNGNTTLISALPLSDANYHKYVRVDGLYMDADGYLWMMNTGSRANSINVLNTKSGQWYSYNVYSAGKVVPFETPGPILADRRNPNYKWLSCQRASQSIVLLNDNGTPTKGSDDRAMMRNSFTDQLGRIFTLETVRCMVQDHNNDLWVGTNTGIIIIQAATDFFTSSACYRVLLDRNDGTNIVDDLLGLETITDIVVDGGNRKWIATASSGLYLVSEDGKTTLRHFTSTNSSLPSNQILSLALHPTTGELFIGTSAGLVSFITDASEPAEDYSSIYAYPNPVRPNYDGVITIVGLMEDSFVTIIDAAGNVILKTRSMGGTAVWDGRLPNGQRAATGVYTVLANAPGAKAHAVTKILVMK